MPPAEPDALVARKAGQQVTVEVTFTLPASAVRREAVEFDTDAEADVLEIGVGDPVTLDAAHLAYTWRQLMRPLDAGDVSMLQHRVGASGEIIDDARPPSSIAHAGTSIESMPQPVGCRAAGADGVGEIGDTVDATSTRERDIDQCFFQTDPRRREMPGGDRVEVVPAMKDDARQRCDAPVSCIRDVHRCVGGHETTGLEVEHGAVRSHGGSDGEHGSPDSLSKGRLTRMAEKHSAAQEHQLASAHETFDLVRYDPRRGQLSSADYAVLVIEERVDAMERVHPPSIAAT